MYSTDHNTWPVCDPGWYLTQKTYADQVRFHRRPTTGRDFLRCAGSTER